MYPLHLKSYAWAHRGASQQKQEHLPVFDAGSPLPARCSRPSFHGAGGVGKQHLRERRREHLCDEVLEDLPGDHRRDGLSCRRRVLGQAREERSQTLGRRSQVSALLVPCVAAFSSDADLFVGVDKGFREGCRLGRIGCPHSKITLGEEARRKLLVLVDLLRMRPDLLDPIELGILRRDSKGGVGRRKVSGELQPCQPPSNLIPHPLFV